MPKISKSVKEGKRIISYYQIGILFPNNKKIVKPRCTLEEVFENYFINLDKYLGKGLTAEELLDKYKETFNKNNIKVQINYIDSWNHRWSGKVAWPKEELFIEYLNKRINNEKNLD